MSPRAGFIIFISAYLAVYGGMNAYLFFKSRAAFGFGRAWSLGIGLFLLFMVFGVFLMRFAERAGLDALAHVLSWVGLTWFGLAFIFFAYGIGLDAVFFALKIAGKYSPGLAEFVPGPRKFFYITLGITSAIAVYGSIAVWDIKLERVSIATDKLPPGVNSLRIVQISDVHLGVQIRERRLKIISDIVREARPDILVSTGDLVDGVLDDLDGLSGMLRDMDAPLGKFAITGNHEFYAGLPQALEFTNKAGFRVLRGEYAEAGGIVIAGVDYTDSRIVEEPPAPDEAGLLSGIPKDKFVLFLKHNPTGLEKSMGLYDLMLSGHTHKGQIFPFSIVTYFVFPHHAGLKDFGGSYLYVSRGTGAWGPQIRFLSPPEVTLFELSRP